MSTESETQDAYPEWAWARNWADSTNANLSSAIQTAVGHQALRQTLYTIILITVIIGFLESLLTQALFPNASYGNITLPIYVSEVR